jgi:hypothetical protein
VLLIFWSAGHNRLSDVAVHSNYGAAGPFGPLLSSTFTTDLVQLYVAVKIARQPSRNSNDV